MGSHWPSVVGIRLVLVEGGYLPNTTQIAYEFGEGSDIHDIDEPKALFFKLSYPSA